MKDQKTPAEVLPYLKSDCDIVVCFSGGKDSVAMVLFLLKMGISKHRIKLHHQDVDGGGARWFDWQCTKSYCQAFAAAFGLDYLEAYREGGIMAEAEKENAPSADTMYQAQPGGEFLRLASRAKPGTRLKFPMVTADPTKRWCSSVSKMEPHARAIRKLYPTGQVLICTGERREESTNRKKYKEVQPHKTWCSTRQALQWRPVIDWSQADVWEIIKDNKVQCHPCYMLGWGRASCKYCIFASANHWATLLDIDVDHLIKIAQKEKDFHYTLYSDETIEQRAWRGTSFMGELDPATRDYWLAQADGEFTAPIIVDMWQQPAGMFGETSCGAA